MTLSSSRKETGYEGSETVGNAAFLCPADAQCLHRYYLYPHHAALSGQQRIRRLFGGHGGHLVPYHAGSGLWPDTGAVLCQIPRRRQGRHSRPLRRFLFADVSGAWRCGAGHRSEPVQRLFAHAFRAEVHPLRAGDPPCGAVGAGGQSGTFPAAECVFFSHHRS